jgi:hypothetical protein
MASIRKRHRNYKRLLVSNSATSSPLHDLSEHAQHLVVNQTVRCEDIVTEQIERFARNAGDQAACFRYQQRPGGFVPGVEFQLPKPIEAASRNGAEIQSR